MEKIVKGCDDCPFKNEDWRKCDHPLGQQIGIILYSFEAPPELCPLKTDSITIKLEQ
jgi:hypothetical protein